MTSRFPMRLTALLAALGACVAPALAGEEQVPESPALLQALVDELARSMELQMEDLERPYFIQYNVGDVLSYDLSAKYGALTSCKRERTRRLYTRVRVGSYELDNTNFAGDEGIFFFFGGRREGGQAELPIDDDYQAIRQAIWRVTDQDYKDAVETLTRKRAYMRDKNIVDRPADFTPAEPVEHFEPPAVLRFDLETWKQNLERISGHFKQYAQVQDSDVHLLVAAGNSYVVNSEGTRVRTADTGALLLITVEVQAADGMRLSDCRTYTGDSTEELPPVEQILADIDALVAELMAVRDAPVLEQYVGPVLFDGLAGCQMFQALLAEGLAGRVDPVGARREDFPGAENLEKRLGQRILPRSFQVWDDPTVRKFAGQTLFGHYRYDEEGVPARRVDLIVDGKLEKLCLSRAPTRKLSGSNGHARQPLDGGAPQAAIGTLFVRDDQGLGAAELKARLLEAARDQGLEYAVRVVAVRSPGLGSTRADLFSMFRRLQRGRVGGLGDPVIAYKVYVADGHEEPFRGCEFGPVQVSDLKDILAAGADPTVYNYVGIGLGGATPPTTIVAPPVLFEELELYKLEEEYDKLPILPAPLAREQSLTAR